MKDTEKDDECFASGAFETDDGSNSTCFFFFMEAPPDFKHIIATTMKNARISGFMTPSSEMWRSFLH